MISNMHCTTRRLIVTSLMFGAIAVVTLALAVATDTWLYTEENIETRHLNHTFVFPINTHSGLWRLCLILNPGDTDNDEADCMNIEYFYQDPGKHDGATVATSITRAIRISAPFPVIGLILVLMAVIVSIVGTMRGDVKTIAAAVLYIMSGMSLAIGIILYVSAINDEVGHRPKARPNDKTAFRYSYGWSFFFASIGFVSAELAAVTCITLYLRKNRKPKDLVRIVPGLEKQFIRSNVLRECLISPNSATLDL